MFNAPDALLPKYRGRTATGWTLHNDEPEYGLTFHYMTPEFDDGPILVQRPVPITDDDYRIEMIFSKFHAAGADLFPEALDRIAAGNPGTPQDESQATFAGGPFEPDWREIDWSNPARHIFIQVRSWYGARDVPARAFGDIDGRRTLITVTRLTGQTSSSAPPGTALERRDDGSLLVQCGDGPLKILRWEGVPG